MSGMKLSVRVDSNRFDELRRMFEGEAARIVLQTGTVIERDSKQSMRGPKHGRVYRRGAITRKYKMGGKAYQSLRGKGMRGKSNGGRVAVTVGYKFHRASAPGEAPAIDYGKLVNSIEMVFQRPLLRSIVYATAAYAIRLEKNLNRPFMRPAAENAWPDFLARMKKLFGV